ncbi:MAG: hypothetical protein HYV02_07945 [Deltaproteobacteria bacterium]|nr:hypothetical protein [Deltaproteobacteria bacterium]
MRRITIWFGLLCIGLLCTWSRLGLATTPCVVDYRVLGFSQDWQQAYWELVIGSECAPALALFRYDFAQNRAEKLFWAYDDDAQFKKGRLEVRKDVYETRKGAMVKSLQTAPTDGRGNQQGAVLAPATFDCRNKITTVNDLPCLLRLTRGAKICTFSRETFADKEAYVTELIRPTESYFNPRYTSWIVLQEHCSVAQTPCYNEETHAWNPAPALAIYDERTCI